MLETEYSVFAGQINAMLADAQAPDFFLAVWPWNLTDDLEKQQSTSSILLQALCIIS